MWSRHYGWHQWSTHILQKLSSWLLIIDIADICQQMVSWSWDLPSVWPTPPSHIWLSLLTYQSVHTLSTSFLDWHIPDDLTGHGICPHFWLDPFLVAPCNCKQSSSWDSPLIWFCSLTDGLQGGDSGDQYLLQRKWRNSKNISMPDLLPGGGTSDPLTDCHGVFLFENEIGAAW